MLNSNTSTSIIKPLFEAGVSLFKNYTGLGAFDFTGSINNQIKQADSADKEKNQRLNEEISRTQQAYEGKKTLRSAQHFLATLKTAKTHFENEKNTLTQKQRTASLDMQRIEENLQKIEPYIVEVTDFIKEQNVIRFKQNKKIAKDAVQYSKGFIKRIFNKPPNARLNYKKDGSLELTELSPSERWQSHMETQQFRQVSEANALQQTQRLASHVPSNTRQAIVATSKAPMAEQLKKSYGKGKDELIDIGILSLEASEETTKIVKDSSIVSNALSQASSKTLDECTTDERIASEKKAYMQLFSKVAHRTEVACAKKYQGGNCGEIALLIANYLEDHPAVDNEDVYIQVVRVDKSDQPELGHEFVVFDLNENADISKLSTYGKNAVIIDPYNDHGDGIYPVRDILAKPNDEAHKLYTTVKWDSWIIQNFGNKDPSLDCASEEFKDFYTKEKEESKEVECQVQFRQG